MRTEEEIREAYEKSATISDNLDDSGNHFDAAAPLILSMGFAWALEEDDAENLLEQLQEDYEELIEE